MARGGRQGARVPRAPGDGSRGKALVAEFLKVHRTIREELAALRGLAEVVAGGASGREVHAKVVKMSATTRLRSLQVNCMTYCGFVRSHHNNEDLGLLPSVRRSAPELAGDVKRLEREHRKVSDLLDQVLGTSRGLVEDEALRVRLVGLLDELAELLLRHLEFEEKKVVPVIRTWQNWPWL